MEIERAIETQRLALLRLLTGLIVAVVLVSRLPAVSKLPMWVRASALSVLSRAEAATACLVIAVAAVFFDTQLKPSSSDAEPLLGEPIALDLPSTEALLHRIAALRAVLSDLPRHAKRLIKRQEKPRAKSHPAGASFVSSTNDRGRLRAEASFIARIDRPPDKPFRLVLNQINFASS